MRIKRIRPVYFRCYGDSEWIDLNSDLVIIYGPNGYGKTSLVESIEWLLHGRAKRREKGKEYSKRDYQNYFQNAHAPKNAITFVEAEISTGSKIYIIKRQLHIGKRNKESTSTFVDGNEATFDSIGLTENTVYDPVIPQHSLQDFIHSRPKDRRDKVSAALGLEPLVQFASSLSKAKNSFRNNPPPNVKDAQEKRDTVFRKVANTSNANPLNSLISDWRSDNYDLTANRSRVVKAVQQFLETDTEEWNSLKLKLRTHYKKVQNRVFDRSHISPHPDWKGMLDKLKKEKLVNIEDQAQLTRDALSTYLSAVKDTYSSELLDLWEVGLRLQKKNSDECPLCEEDTLDGEKRSELRERLDSASTLREANKKLLSHSNSLSQSIQEILKALKRIIPSPLENVVRDQLKSVFSDPSQYAGFLELHDKIQAKVKHVGKQIRDLISNVESVPDRADKPEKVSGASLTLEGVKSTLEEVITTISTALRKYDKAFEAFEERLLKVISSSNEVQETESYLTTMENWDSIIVVAEHQQLITDALEVARHAKTHLKAKQDTLFETRGKEIDKWYNILSPGSKVSFSHMEAGKDSLSLYATSFDETMNAAASLSQCQANCLGLSIHFMRVMSSSSPYNFIVLDDPVQSMDDDHSQALLTNVVSDLINDYDTQVIFFSHLQNMTDKLKRIHYSIMPKCFHISDYRKTGPIFTSPETVKSCIQQVKRFKSGDEEDRRVAVLTLRRAVELFVRKVCEKHNCTPPGDDDSFGKMKKLFLRCSGTATRHADILETVVDFANPAAHTQVGWSVPKESQIKPHADRIEQLAKQEYDVWNI